jgi:tetratricopeptide (TPR) repeat protein
MYGFKNLSGRHALLVIFAAAMFAVSCGSAPRQRATIPETVPEEAVPERFIDRLAALLNAGDIDGAVLLFDELSPDEAALKQNRRLKASVLLSAHRLKDARAIAESLLDEDKTDVESRFVLSNIEGASGKTKEQRLLLEKIVKDDPNHVPALNDLGQIFISSKSLREAASCFDRAFAADPEDMGAILGRANVYRLERKTDEALALFDKAVSLHPERGEPYSERGRFYRETGSLKKALADLETAKKFAPQDYWVCYDKGRVLLEMRNKSEALSEFESAIKINPDIFIAYVYSAGIRDELEDVDGAERDYEAITRLRPEYYFAFEGLGIQKMKKGLYTEAAEAFAAAYKAAPNENNYAMLAAVNMLKGGGKPHEIRPFVEQAMRKIDRARLDYHVLRLFFDFSGDADVVRRIDQEKNQSLKAQMLFYMANYYDIKGNPIIADRFFIEFRDMKRMELVEWRLNEWILKERNIEIGGADGGFTAEKG